MMTFASELTDREIDPREALSSVHTQMRRAKLALCLFEGIS